MEFIHKTNQNDTIAALATPPGSGGIAIIRISGPEALRAASALCRSDLEQQSSHTVSLKTIVSAQGKLLDQALVLVMRAPRSFTGEETVEIHCHGGHLIARNILEELFTGSVRPAEPGEFSFRAFLNGKIDLTQAEAVQDLIGARNQEALRVAEDQLEGRLSTHIQQLQKQATQLCALFEAWVDFPEDDIEFIPLSQALSELTELSRQIRHLIDTFDSGKILQQGLSICILGAPNVGKSSLMNSLLGKDRAIVSSVAGTTRDIVEDDLLLNGLHCKIIDTAGIRETQESIEKEGVIRSKKAMANADIILAVLDASRAQDPLMFEPVVQAPPEKSIFIWNKIDIATSSLPELSHPYSVRLSAKTGEGLDSLSQALDSITWKGKGPNKTDVVITNLRHKNALEEAEKAILQTLEGLKNDISPEFLSMDMKEALVALGSIIGTNITEDILSSIFSRFCIGK